MEKKEQFLRINYKGPIIEKDQKFGFFDQKPQSTHQIKQKTGTLSRKLEGSINELFEGPQNIKQFQMFK